MNITIQVQTDTALALHRQQPTTASKELLQAAKELSVTLEPMHPGTRDSRLMTYFTVRVPNQEMAQRAIARFQRCAAVEAAYLKPLDEMP